MLNFTILGFWVGLSGLVLALILAIWNFYLQSQVRKLLERNKELYGDKEAPRLEEAMAFLKKELTKEKHDINELQDIVTRLYGLANISLQKIGVVRYNPFGDTGGDQSFALAMLDRQHSGVVLSSLHAREGTRIYAKAIQKGVSKHPLSDEEQDAIRKAIKAVDFKNKKLAAVKPENKIIK